MMVATALHTLDGVTARQALRRETADVHDALHQDALLKRLADGSISVAEYGTLMQRFARFYVVMDRALIAASAEFADALAGYAYAPRAPIFAADLRALGLEAGSEKAAEGDAAGMSSAIRSVQALAGTVYVVEGSMLGGSQLHRSAAAVLGGDAGLGYWLWCRQHGGRRFAATRAFVESAGRTSGDRLVMIRSARAAFDQLGAMLSPEKG